MKDDDDGQGLGGIGRQSEYQPLALHTYQACTIQCLISYACTESYTEAHVEPEAESVNDFSHPVLAACRAKSCMGRHDTPSFTQANTYVPMPARLHVTEVMYMYAYDYWEST